MEIKLLLAEARRIWGNEKLNLAQIIVRMGKIFGDICKYERDEKVSDREGGEEELKKELGNMIVSTVRWCDDLGYDPEDCVEAAVNAQKRYRGKVQN